MGVLSVLISDLVAAGEAFAWGAKVQKRPPRGGGPGAARLCRAGNYWSTSTSPYRTFNAVK